MYTFNEFTLDYKPKSPEFNVWINGAYPLHLLD